MENNTPNSEIVGIILDYYDNLVERHKKAETVSVAKNIEVRMDTVKELSQIIGAFISEDYKREYAEWLRTA